MKTRSPDIMNIRGNSRSGIALVLVLTMLVLLSALLVAFMQSATTETASSKAFTQQMEARQAADAAVNMVIGQIRDATTGVEDGASPDPSKTSSSGFTWASQPGAIRTYGTGGRATVYKLYSAENMREAEQTYKTTAVTDAAIDLEDPEKNGFVDINEPALVRVEGSDPNNPSFDARYPIVNPYGKYKYNQAAGKFQVGANPKPGEGAIEGFYCEDTKDPDRKDADGNPIPLLPMRVKWIYILKDGKFAAVDSNGKIKGATVENPPIARTAFWTDDETAKLNVNTATEGTYWDVPSVGTYQESGNAGGQYTDAENKDGTSLNFAVSQPARHEWQRYPGHPATTCLSPALRWLFPGYKNPYDPPQSTPTQRKDPDVVFKETIYRMAPRVVGGKGGKNPETNGKNHNGTSIAGTFNTDRDVPSGQPVDYFAPVSADHDRLFATVDEYFFRPDRTAVNTPAKYNNIYNAATSDIALPEFRPNHVEKLRFFLTAHSRTPETNMFGRPRVTVWPVFGDLGYTRATTRQTPFDELFAFCSTLGSVQDKSEYYFKRQFPLDPYADFNAFPQNQRLYAYLQYLTEQRIPWLDKSILMKYSGASNVADPKLNRDQILTEIFDYIRSTNLVDTSTTKSGQQYGASYTPFYWPLVGGRAQKQAQMPLPYSGQVVPIQINNGAHTTKGFGRFPTLAEAALVFYKSPLTMGNAQAPAGFQASQFVKMQAVLLLEMFNPAQGYPALRDTYGVRVRIGPKDPSINLDTVAGGVNGMAESELDWFEIRRPDGINVFDPADQFQKRLNFERDNFNMVTVDPYSGPIARVFIPFRGFANQLLFDPQWNGAFTGKKPDGSPQVTFTNHSWDLTKAKTFAHQVFKPKSNISAASNHSEKVYPFYSDTVIIPTGGGPVDWKNRFGFKGGTFIIDIYGTADPLETDIPVQSIRVKFGHPTDESKTPIILPVPTSTKDFQARLVNGLNGTQSNASPNGSNRNTLNPDVNGGYGWIEAPNNSASTQAGDVIRSVEVGDAVAGSAAGDQRMVAALPRVGYAGANGTLIPGTNYYQPRGGVGAYATKWANPTLWRVHGLRMSRGANYETNSNPNLAVPDGRLAKGVTSYRTDRWPRVPVRANGQLMDGVMMKNGNPGDWDRGLSKNVSGAFINKADEGNANFNYSSTGGTRLPYFLGFGGFEEAGPTFFSPNRLMPSAVMFGSLPTHVHDGDRPWETLLFRPPVMTGSKSDHPGFETVPDHYYLDFFHMPVVEPYPISEPFSTAGKINLNYEIAPYGYATRGPDRPYLLRTTGLHGVLKSTMMLAVGRTAIDGGHTENPLGNTSEKWRFYIDRRSTLKLMQDRLNTQGLFKTASEICEIPLVPEAASGINTSNPLSTNWDTFWNTTYNQTGDNQRERPYAYIYPRVTTRSNTYTVYVRAQSIRKSPSTPIDEFDEKRDQVTGEYRGETTIERYIDPNDKDLDKYDPTQKAGSAGSIERYYRFRIVNQRQFIGS